MFRPSFLLQGNEYDLAHLAPAKMECPRGNPSEPPLIIEITFSHHCYTVSASHDPVSAELYRVSERGDARFFDHTRWQLSRDYLPAMLTALPRARVEFTAERRNYRYALNTRLQDGSEYALFFSLRKSSNPDHHLHMVVESAYPIPAGSRGRLPGEIRFAVLAMKVLRGEKVHQPPRW